MTRSKPSAWILSLALLGGFAAHRGAAAPDGRFDQGPAGGFAASVAEAAAAQASPSVDVGPPASVPRGRAATEPAESRIVVFAKGVPRPRRLELAQSGGASAPTELWLADAVSVVMPAARARALEEALADRREVLRVEKDPVVNWLLPPPRATRPRADRRGSSESLPWNILRVHAPEAWSFSRGGGVKVAVLDTGIDLRHRALKVVGGFNALDPNGSYNDDEGHGTHVAGIVAAQDVGAGVIGVAPDVELYAVKVLSKSGGGTFTTIIAGLQWCVARGMDVANMSFGSPADSAALADAVRNAAAAGVTLVAAAGNTGGPVVRPAAYPGVIAVAASDTADAIPDWSNRGRQVAFAAPGVEIRSTFIDGEYAFKDGTSMAAPHIAGLASLLMAARGVRGGAEVLSVLAGAATPLPGGSPESQGAGMVDARKLARSGLKVFVAGRGADKL